MLSVFDEPQKIAEEKSRKDSYRLGTDDVIRITVDQHPEWSGEYTIAPNGKIRVTDLGEIAVEGFSTADLESHLSTYLSSFVKDPKISIDIVRYASEVIYVLGAVERPGKITTGGKNTTVRDAVVMASLPSVYAKTSTVFVITPSRKSPRKQVVNLSRILYHGELENNIEVKPGDIVYVPQNILGIINEIVSALLSPLYAVGAAGTAHSVIYGP